MNDLPTSVPCELPTDEREERARAWHELDPMVVGRGRTADGFRVVFEPPARERLEGLVAAERSCCGWATWSLEADDERAVLVVTGASPALDSLAAPFGL